MLRILHGEPPAAATVIDFATRTALPHDSAIARQAWRRTYAPTGRVLIVNWCGGPFCARLVRGPDPRAGTVVIETDAGVRGVARTADLLPFNPPMPRGSPK